MQQGVAHLGKWIMQEDACLPRVRLEQHRPQHAVGGDALIHSLASICGPLQLCHLQHAGLAGRPLVVRLINAHMREQPF